MKHIFLSIVVIFLNFKSTHHDKKKYILQLKNKTTEKTNKKEFTHSSINPILCNFKKNKNIPRINPETKFTLVDSEDETNINSNK